MWIPTKFETRPVTIKPEHGPAFAATELWADDVRVCRAVERVRWDEDPIHLQWYADCLTGDCADGAWMSARRAGSHVLFLPSFWWWLEGDWYDRGYDEAPGFMKRGAMLLDRALYTDLHNLVPELPAMPDLQPLVGWEVVRLLRFEAPVEILGKASQPVQLQRGLVLGTDWWHPNEVAVRTLEQLLEAWVVSYEPVALKTLPWVQVPVSFYLGQESRSIEWQPLASGGRDRLLLAPGFVVDKMPELPEGTDTNRLMVITQPGKKGHSLDTEIRVDNRALYDFTGLWLGVDLCELGRSSRWDGEYFIITCSCGIAGCAGIHRGVDVYRDDGRIYWVIYEPGPERTFVFDEQAYRRAVETALLDFRDLCARHPMSALDRYRLASLAEIDERARRF